MAKKKWETYEEVAAYLLEEFKDKFGLEEVEGKQIILGERSGTGWEVDAKGVKEGNQGFVIIECRQHLTSRQRQEQIAGLAYRIIDTGAKGGILVSPLGIQEGGKKIAQAENIISVNLSEQSTRQDYLLRFLTDVMSGVSDVTQIKDEVFVIKNPPPDE